MTARLAWGLTSLLITAGPALAQSTPVHVTVGLGAAAPYRTAFVASVDVGHGPVLQAGIATSTALDALDQNPVLSGLHVGAGWAWPTRWGRVRAGAGPAWMFARDRELVPSSGVGVVADGVATVRLAPCGGIGVGAFVAAGTVGTGAGVALTMSAGSALR